MLRRLSFSSNNAVVVVPKFLTSSCRGSLTQRTRAKTLSLWTSRPAQRGYSTSIVLPSPVIGGGAGRNSCCRNLLTVLRNEKHPWQQFGVLVEFRVQLSYGFVTPSLERRPLSRHRQHFNAAIPLAPPTLHPSGSGTPDGNYPAITKSRPKNASNMIHARTHSKRHRPKSSAAELLVVDSPPLMDASDKPLPSLPKNPESC